MTIQANTKSTLPSVEETWPWVFPRFEVPDPGLKFGNRLSSETSSLKEHASRSVMFETFGEDFSPSAYEKPEERAHTQREVWETLRRFLKLSAQQLSIETKSQERLTTEPLHLPRRIDVSESHFTSEILSAIEAEPVEDGYRHPAEKLLRLLLIDHSSETIKWLHTIISHERNASIVASILKCLGRVELEICNNWGFNLVGTALEHPDVEVRDAAVQILEIWGTAEAARLLEKHQDREQVLWLRSYIERVIQDLKGAWELSHGSCC